MSPLPKLIHLYVGLQVRDWILPFRAPNYIHKYMLSLQVGIGHIGT